MKKVNSRGSVKCVASAPVGSVVLQSMFLWDQIFYRMMDTLLMSRSYRLTQDASIQNARSIKDWLNETDLVPKQLFSLMATSKGEVIYERGTDNERLIINQHRWIRF